VEFSNLGSREERLRLVLWMHEDGASFPAPLALHSELYPVAEMLSALIMDRSLSEKVGQELWHDKLLAMALDVIQSDMRDMTEAVKKRFGREGALLEHVKQSNGAAFYRKWRDVNRFLKRATRSDFPPPFYLDVMRDVPPSGMEPRLEAIKEHLLLDWQTHLNQRKQRFMDHFAQQRKSKLKGQAQAAINRYDTARRIAGRFIQKPQKLWDYSQPSSVRHSASRQLQHYIDLLDRDPGLRMLADLLGRHFEQIHQSVPLVGMGQPMHHQSCHEEILGIRFGDDLNDLLPIELALLADHEADIIFLERFAHKRLQLYDYQGRIPMKESSSHRHDLAAQQAGPIVICMDVSGSMFGTAEWIAKSVALGLVRIALQQQRPCRVIFFSTRAEKLDFSHSSDAAEAFARMLGKSASGGTSPAIAIREAVQAFDLENYQHGDLLLISDFMFDLFDQQTIQSMMRAKQRGNRFHSLAVCRKPVHQGYNPFDYNWLYNLYEREALSTLNRQIRLGLETNSMEPLMNS